MANAVYQRRNELAKEQGFSSYADKRKQLEYASKSGLFRDTVGKPNARSRDDLHKVKVFYRAMKEDKSNYSRDSAKAEWFVEIADLMDYDEWEDRYPGGTR